jgi:hypothetical protein
MRRQDLGRYAALGVAGSRVAFGAAVLAMPERLTHAVAGRQGRHAGNQLIARAAGGRDAVLGTAAAIALARGRDPKLWTAAQLAADVTDLAAGTAMRDGLPRVTRKLWLSMAGGASAVLAAALAAQAGGRPAAKELGGEPEQTMPSQSTAAGVDSVVISGESQDDPR